LLSELEFEKDYFIPLSERKYNILLILTDGKIDDMKETKNILVEASNYPLSVIIVGIGNANFGNMNELDGDHVPLKNSQGVKRERDIVQFVEFSKYENDGDLLAEQVLREIPRQIEEYYRLHGI